MHSDAAVHTELWTSWASVLRSYAAAHGLYAAQHAVVEVSATSVTLRAGSRWLRFTHTNLEGSDLPSQSFQILPDGTVRVDGAPAEALDLAAERFAREILLP